MDGELDIEAASAEIGESLGLGESLEDTPDDLPELDVAEGSGESEGAPADVSDAEVVAEAAPAVAEPKHAPPQTWRQEALAKWDTVDPLIQQEILKREADVHRGIAGYKQAAEAWKLTHQAIAPYLPTLQQHRIDPITQIQSLMDINHRLATGTPDEKRETLSAMAKHYGVEWNDLNPESQPWVDPQVASLQETVKSLQSSLYRLEQAPVALQRRAIAAEVDKFASDPANIHFETVFPEMASMLKADDSLSLKDAYEKAVWANPKTRAEALQAAEKARAAETAKAAEVARTAAAAKTAAARRATGVNVRTAAHSGRGVTPLGSIDDTLAQTYANIQRRRSA